MQTRVFCGHIVIAGCEGNGHELENEYSFRSIRTTISCQTWDDVTNRILASHLSLSETTSPRSRRRPAHDAEATPHELHSPAYPAIVLLRELLPGKQHRMYTLRNLYRRIVR